MHKRVRASDLRTALNEATVKSPRINRPTESTVAGSLEE